MTARDLITDALYELNAYSPGESIPNESLAIGLVRLNSLIDMWNADKLYAYAQVFSVFSWTGNQPSRTIGPTGNFALDLRPEAILSANFVDTSVSPSVRFPLYVGDAQWWNDIRIRDLGNTIPIGIYYEPDFPNGTIYMWPYPTVTRSIEVQTEKILSSLALTDAFTFPPAYQRGLTMTLAEDLSGPFSKPISGDLERKARKARGVIQGANSRPPRIATRDSGMPGQAVDPLGTYRNGRWFR